MTITNKQILGKKINDHPKLKWVEDIEYFDGPLLSIYSQGKVLWLVSWCDISRFKTWSTTKLKIDKYLNQEIDYLSMIPEKLYLIDDFEFKSETWFAVEKNQLPDSYLPNENCFYDSELSPEK